MVANRKEDQTWAPKYLIFWRAWRDSNPQPSDPKFVLIRIQPYHQSKGVSPFLFRLIAAWSLSLWKQRWKQRSYSFVAFSTHKDDLPSDYNFEQH